MDLIFGLLAPLVDQAAQVIVYWAIDLIRDTPQLIWPLLGGARAPIIILPMIFTTLVFVFFLAFLIFRNFN